MNKYHLQITSDSFNSIKQIYDAVKHQDCEIEYHAEEASRYSQLDQTHDQTCSKPDEPAEPATKSHLLDLPKMPPGRKMTQLERRSLQASLANDIGHLTEYTHAANELAKIIKSKRARLEEK